MTPKSIIVYNRAAGRTEEELIYGEGFMRWFYETPSGRMMTNGLLSRALFSRLYGRYKDTFLSARAVPRFIEDFGIPMEEFDSGPFKSFNDFFIRRFRPGIRKFSAVPSDFCAFAEGRYLAFESTRPDDVFPVKGSFLSAAGLLSDPEQARIFEGGPLVIARLCPTDYHRYHYPDAGRTLKSWPVSGRLHSVSPLALAQKGDIFITNERRVSILETENFGTLAYIEVGAICVGKIVQTWDESMPFARGGEKGYFLFGGSTVIVLGQKGRWKPDPDLLAQTQLKHETLIRLGERIASAEDMRT